MDNIKECLDFLELPPNAADAAIQQRINEKQKLFAQLLQNAPNEYLKNIHSKNVAKLAEIQSFFNKGYAASNNYSHAAKATQNNHVAAGAWLIRHTENLQPKSFQLHSGKNFIGRVSGNNTNEIIIDDDIYVSRSHAIITLENNSCKITDTNSKNGTYINSNQQRIKTATLNNSDTIQIGNTKLVLKLDINKNIDSLIKEVDNSEYMKTIVIDIL